MKISRGLFKLCSITTTFAMAVRITILSSATLGAQGKGASSQDSAPS
jgi:hypothetical protein